jgi:hypothetical protein
VARSETSEQGVGRAVNVPTPPDVEQQELAGVYESLGGIDAVTVEGVAWAEVQRRPLFDVQHAMRPFEVQVGEEDSPPQVAVASCEEDPETVAEHERCGQHGVRGVQRTARRFHANARASPGAKCGRARAHDASATS